MLPMDVTTETEPMEASTMNVVDSAAVVAGPTGQTPEEAASFKLDEAATDHVAVPTAALDCGDSVSQGGADGSMQGSPMSCAEKSTGSTETDPETPNRPSSAGKLWGPEGVFKVLPFAIASIGKRRCRSRVVGNTPVSVASMFWSSCPWVNGTNCCA